MLGVQGVFVGEQKAIIFHPGRDVEGQDHSNILQTKRITR